MDLGVFLVEDTVIAKLYSRAKRINTYIFDC
jgi:hypothetical protein